MIKYDYILKKHRQVLLHESVTVYATVLNSHRVRNPAHAYPRLYFTTVPWAARILGPSPSPPQVKKTCAHLPIAEKARSHHLIRPRLEILVAATGQSGASRRVPPLPMCLGRTHMSRQAIFPHRERMELCALRPRRTWSLSSSAVSRCT